MPSADTDPSRIYQPRVAWLANDLGGAVDLWIGLLQQKGINVKHIQNGGEAITEFQHVPYDAIAMDLHITCGLDCQDKDLLRYAQHREFGMIGLEVITRTRRDTSINHKTPIVVVCNYRKSDYSLFPQAKEKSLQAGANDYFCPLEMEVERYKLIVNTIVAHATKKG